MANGKPDGDERNPFILHILSEVLPKDMPRFMNDATWHAAWLSQCLGWVRLMVGYALTGVPERVLEIFYVPDGDAQRGQDILNTLSEKQRVVRARMMESCKNREEEQLPVVRYDTELDCFIQSSEKESNAAAQWDAAQRKIDEINARLKVIKKRVEQAEKDLETHGGGPGGEDLRKRLDDAIAEQAIEESKLRVPEGEQKLADAKMKDARAERVVILDELPAFFLYVDIMLKPGADQEEYIRGMSRLIKEFRWKFIATGQRRSPKRPDNQQTAAPEFIHFWEFDEANELYHQMVELRENERYTALAELVESQSHTLMCDWEALSRTKRAPRLVLPSGRHKGVCSRPPPPQKDDLVIIIEGEEPPPSAGRPKCLGREPKHPGRKPQRADLYLLRKSEYQNSGHEAPPSVLDKAKPLAELRVLMAGMPVRDDNPGAGRMFLVNLSGFSRGADSRAPTPPELIISPPLPLPPRKDDVPGDDDLVIVDREGAKFYWVRKSEYQNEQHKLDPLLAEQLLLLVNQGVVLADIPGDVLPDVESMGCLVNLLGIKGLDAREGTDGTPMSQR